MLLFHNGLYAKVVPIGLSHILFMHLASKKYVCRIVRGCALNIRCDMESQVITRPIKGPLYMDHISVVDLMRTIDIARLIDSLF
jgi:hypothetical protein